MLIYRKISSVIRQRKGSVYSRSIEWENHPLNIPEANINFEKIDSELLSLKHCRIVDFYVNPAEYKDFNDKIKFGCLYAVSCRSKKIVEHFVAFKVLELRSGDTYIDVGSQDSPFPRVLRKLGINAFSQDIEYKPGIHNRHIGSSADNIPMPDSSVDKISMQCAFEHFNGDVDTYFIKELSRILKPGGKCCIVPLYLSNTFTNYVDPSYDYSRVMFDDGAKVIGEVNLGGIFERKYSVESLDHRILLRDIGLEYTILMIKNAESVSKSPMVNRIRYVLLIKKTGKRHIR